MANQDLTTEEGMRDWLLAHHNYSCTSVQRLPEGFGGFVYRVKLDGHPDGLLSVIVKHAEGYAARATSWKMNQERMNFERKAMNFIEQRLPKQADIPVRTPRIMHYDNVAHVLIMEDAGDIPSVKSWFHANVDLETTRKVGTALGDFLAHFHNVTAGDFATLKEFEGNETGKYISSTLYFDGLVPAAKKFGISADEIALAAEIGAKEVRKASEVLTLGDFWTGNVLVSTPANDGSLGELELFVLDLELAKPGTAAFDIGQMAAEMYALAVFRERDRGMALLETFLRAYKTRRKGGVDKATAAKVAIRIGAHLVVIVPNAWRIEDEELIEKQVSFGVELIRMGTDLDVDALRKSIVQSLIS